MSRDPLRVLFLCTGNSARSIMAEVLLNARGRGRFLAQSAGSRPAGAVHPAAIERLKRAGHRTDGLHPKSWDGFEGAAAPDYVITLCDEAAKEACPVRGGGVVAAHWGIPDPAAVHGDRAATSDAFDRAYRSIEQRIGALLRLPLNDMDAAAARAALQAIGARTQ